MKNTRCEQIPKIYPVPLCLVNIVSSILDFQYSLAMHLPPFTKKKKKKIDEFVEKCVVFFVIFLRIGGRIWKNSDTMYSRNQVCACVRVTFFVVLIEKKRGNNMSKTKKKSIVITTRDERGRDCFFFVVSYVGALAQKTQHADTKCLVWKTKKKEKLEDD